MNMKNNENVNTMADTNFMNTYGGFSFMEVLFLTIVVAEGLSI